MRALKDQALLLLLLLPLPLSLSAWLVLPAEVLLAQMQEGALIENATAALYVMAACAAAIYAARNRILLRVALPMGIVLLACAARESDWHTLFTGTSMLRVSYYLRPAPLLHKFVSLTTVLCVAGSIAYLMVFLVQEWRKPGATAAKLRSWAILFFGVLLSGKVADRSLSIVSEFTAFAGGDNWRALQLVIEEPLELVLPLLVLVGLWRFCTAPHGPSSSEISSPEGADHVVPPTVMEVTALPPLTR